MKVILLEDVKSLGKKDEVVKASDAYARNVLIPKKWAVEATPAALNDLKLKNRRAEKHAQENYEKALALKEDLKDKTVELKMKAGAGGKAFGSVSSKEISQAVKTQLDLELDKKKMLLNEPIKSFGVHEVTVKLHPKVTAILRVKVTEE